MAAGDGSWPDWRDAAAYAPLLHADRSFFAWEWLRRDCGYRAAAEQGLGPDFRSDPIEPQLAPERWGLLAFVPPGVSVPEARPVWRAQVHPFVLDVEVRVADGEDVFDLARFGTISRLVKAADGREHLLISDGLRAIRADTICGTLAGGPVEFCYRFAGLASVERPLLTLRRLLALWRTGRFCRSLHRPEARARRWILMLRACDALEAGANQREIAARLLNSGAERERWRAEAPSLRAQVQRLVKGARRLASGGFWELLR
jgi:hypothetical protein